MSETINLSDVPETMLQTVYCAGQVYQGKQDEVRQVGAVFKNTGCNQAGAGGGVFHWC